MSQHHHCMLMPKGMVNQKEHLETRRCSPAFSRVLTGSSPLSTPRSSSVEVPVVERGCLAPSQLMTGGQFLAYFVGSSRGSPWPEAQNPSLPASFPTTGLPQAQLLSAVVFPHFLRVNSSSFTEKSETKSFASAPSSFHVSAISLFSLCPRDYSVGACWQVQRGPGSFIRRSVSPTW